MAEAQGDNRPSVYHDPDIDRFVAINAALEIDLMGQVNCEWAGGRRIAGVGGALDFMRGAQVSPGGRAITMIEAAGKGGASRVVARLSAPAALLPS